MTPAEQASEELRAVAGALIRRLRAESGDPIYARPLVSVLRRLDSDGPMTTADLARAEFMTPQSMGASVAELEEHGLVARTDDPSDGRRKLVSLTREGSQVLAESRARRRTWLVRAIEAELDVSEQRRLLGALELLRRVTESTTHQP